MTSTDRRIAKQRTVVASLRQRLQFEIAVLDRLERRDGSSETILAQGRAFAGIRDVLAAARRRT